MTRSCLYVDISEEDWERRREAFLQKYKSVEETSARQNEQLVLNRAGLDSDAKYYVENILLTGITHQTVSCITVHSQI